MKEERLYLAGKLFKDGDIRQRLYEEKIIKEQCAKTGKAIKVYNPINNDEINDKADESHVVTAEDIFVGDKNHVLPANIMFAELDDEDSGTMYELGMATGINLIYDLLKAGYPIEQIMEKIPAKDIYVHLSDIRQDSKGYEGRYLPWGVNQFVVGGIEYQGHGKIFRHAEDAAAEIANRLGDK